MTEHPGEYIIGKVKISIDEALWKEMKIAAIEKDITLEDLIKLSYYFFKINYREDCH